jgi:hypothetical protein
MAQKDWSDVRKASVEAFIRNVRRFDELDAYKLAKRMTVHIGWEKDVLVYVFTTLNKQLNKKVYPVTLPAIHTLLESRGM